MWKEQYLILVCFDYFVRFFYVAPFEHEIYILSPANAVNKPRLKFWSHENIEVGGSS